ncbi:MAG: nitroreductase family protein [Bacillota bacterium]|nr:nitroreductase family protein [Bacillota bacterium]
MSTKLYIDDALCNSCGLCLQECGHFGHYQNEKRIKPDNPECSMCYHCYTICPQNAVKLEGCPEVPAFSKELLENINQENLAVFLSYRRSIRNYTDKTLDDTIVKKLIENAKYIPSGGNAHSYEFTVIKSEESKKAIKNELYKIYKKRSSILNNVFLRNIVKPFVNKQMRAFLNDMEYREKIRKLIERLYHGEDPIFHNATVIILIHSKLSIPTPKEDCVLAGYNITLMAQALGLGSCYVTLAQNAINASSRCKKLLKLSPEDNINTVITLGYPAVQHRRIAPRRNKEINWL